MNIDFENRAKKNLKKLKSTECQKIESIIEEIGYLESFNQIKTEKLSGTKDRYKIRCGNYRIVIKKITNTHIEITAIADRSDIYNKLFGITF